MAPPHWQQTEKKIKTELEGLFLNSPQQLTDLLSPQPVSDQIRPNILIRYPGFLNWLRDLAESHVPALMHNLKAPGRYRLKHEIALYQSRKRGYEKWVKNLLDDAIWKRWTGKAICREIAAASRNAVSIVPYLKKNKRDYNASESAEDEAAGTSVGMPILDNEGKPKGGSGMGTGSNARIDFSPGMWGLFSDGRSEVSQPSGPGSNPDEVLFHELVHACRDLRGLSYLLRVDGKFDNEEEFLAVVIDDIYLSEKGQPKLLANHEDETVMKDPDKFLDQHINPEPRVLLERLRLSQGSLFDSLARIGPDLAKFNPIWKYNEELKHGKKPPR